MTNMVQNLNVFNIFKYTQTQQNLESSHISFTRLLLLIFCQSLENEGSIGSPNSNTKVHT